MLILAIETSCDDTGVAVIEAEEPRTRTSSVRGRHGYQHGKTRNFRILSNVISSQVKLHAKYGGVYPSLAKREHQRNLVPVLEKALEEANQLILRPRSDLSRKDHSNNKKLNDILIREKILLKKLLPFLKKYQKPKIDLIAVTIGPGLEPCLWAGVNFARALATAWNLPIVPVNHVEAHIAANFISGSSNDQIPTTKQIPPASPSEAGRANSKFPACANLPAPAAAGPAGEAGVSAGRQIPNSILFPAVALVVSGGHTQLMLMQGFGQYKIIGETRDDAAGECFDKAARILGLGYPGGPAIAELAQRWKSQIPNSVPSGHLPQGDKSQTNSLGLAKRNGTGKFKIPRPRPRRVEGGPNSKFNIKLPRPMLNQKNYDFSFSGLKTAVLYELKKQTKKTLKDPKYIQAMCHETQQAIIDVLVLKTIKAAKEFKTKSIILGGGVIANRELREQLKQKVKKELPTNSLLIIPDSIYCTDNAAMVAITGYYQWLRREKKDSPRFGEAGWPKIKAEANLRLK